MRRRLLPAPAAYTRSVTTYIRRNDGTAQRTRFADHDRSEPGIALAADAPAQDDEVLEAAIAQYGEVDGLREAWAERFALLGGPKPTDVFSFLSEVAGEAFDEDRLTVEYTFEHGGQTFVHLHDGDPQGYDWDTEEYDENLTCDIPFPTERLAEYEEAVANGDARKEYEHLTMLRERVAAGRIAPWNAVATEEQIKAAADFEQVERRGQHESGAFGAVRGRNAANRRENLDRIESILAERELTEADVETLPNARTFERPVFKAADFAESIRKRAAARERVARAGHMMRDAEALPEGPLKEMLLGVRPERSYSTTEGTGRKKRTVGKTYTPESELQKEVAEARGNLARSDDPTAFGSYAYHIASFRTLTANEERDALMVAESRKRVAEKWWATGFPGDDANLPAMPEGWSSRI